MIFPSLFSEIFSPESPLAPDVQPCFFFFSEDAISLRAALADPSVPSLHSHGCSCFGNLKDNSTFRDKKSMYKYINIYIYIHTVPLTFDKKKRHRL